MRTERTSGSDDPEKRRRSMIEREREAFWWAATLPTDVQERLWQMVEEAATPKEFFTAIMTGDCPKCGSARTCDGSDLDPEEGDLCEGICLSCGYRWCTECGGPYGECDWDDEAHGFGGTGEPR